MTQGDVYASPRLVNDLGECHFYHTQDIPGYGLVEGAWDLRSGVDEYLGGVGFMGKRVLELGTASGFLCFQMEKRGAEVVAYDLSHETESWDLVPFATLDLDAAIESRRNHIRRLNNGYWLCHRAFESKAKVVYGSVYSVPAQIGQVDISTFGSILLHLRDPFLALQSALRLTRETVIITELAPRKDHVLVQLIRRVLHDKPWPWMRFQPNFRTGRPFETWWLLPPQTITEFIGVLGFDTVGTHYHSQKHRDGYVPLYTLVGKRRN